MSWLDYGLTNTMPANAPIKNDHLTALKLAIRERLYVCKNSEYSSWAFDISPVNTPRFKSTVQYIDYYVWEILPSLFYYATPGTPLTPYTQYTIPKLVEIVGPRENIIKPTVKWLNQTINILNLFTTTSYTFSTVYGRININGGSNTWANLVTYYQNSAPTSPGNFPAGTLYSAAYFTGGTGYNISSLGGSVFTYSPYEVNNDYSYLIADVISYLYCYKLTYPNTVFASFSGLLENTNNYWKTYGGKVLNATWNEPWITKAETITGNSFTQPNFLNRPSPVCLTTPTVYLSNITFEFITPEEE